MKSTLLLLSFLFTCILIYADERKPVKLNDSHLEEQVKLNYCNIFIKKYNTEDDEKSKVIIRIENLNESYVIILFGHAYSEKQLKKLSPSISFDKYFPGTKGHRDTEPCSDGRGEIYIRPNTKAMLPEIMVKNGEVKIFRLPIYIAKYKKQDFWGTSNGKNKIVMLEKETLELEIEVAAESKIDEDYIRIENNFNSLIEELNKLKFCNNPKHKPSLEEQELPYKDRIDSIKSEIDKIKEMHNWFDYDKEFKKYHALKQQLTTIDFTAHEEDCGKHKRPDTSTNCKYCNLTPQEISHKLEDYYKKIFSSNNRKETKNAVMSDVNLLYGCGKHSSKWKNSKYKSGIEKYYRGIMQF